MTKRYIATAVALAAASLTGCNRIDQTVQNAKASIQEDEQARRRATYTAAMNEAQTRSRGFKLLSAEQLAIQIDKTGDVKPPVDVLIKMGGVQSAYSYNLQRPTVAACLAAGQAASADRIICIDQRNHPLMHATRDGNYMKPGF